MRSKSFGLVVIVSFCHQGLQDDSFASFVAEAMSLTNPVFVDIVEKRHYSRDFGEWEHKLSPDGSSFPDFAEGFGVLD